MQIYKPKWWYCCYTFRLENLMINKIITLFKIARKLAQSEAMEIISKIHEPPKIIKLFF